MDRPQTRLMASRCLALALLLSVTTLAGCSGPLVGLGLNTLLPEHKKVKVPADYHGLDNRSVAVVVSMNEYTYAQHPDAQKDLCWAVSKELRKNVPGVSVVDPDDLIAFKRENPYWNTMRYSQLAQRLNVERVVFIDVLQYSLHEPGNQHVLQGVIAGDVRVIEADANPASSRGDSLAYSKTVEARYPQDHPFGVIDGDARTIELATLADFSRKLGYLFYDHQELRKR